MLFKMLRRLARINSCVLSLLFVSHITLSEGFLPHTLVKTKNNYVPICELKENDSVISFDFKSKQLVETKISKIKKTHYEKSIKILINGKEIITAPDHKFYLPLHEKNRWIKAQDLKANDLILSNFKEIVRIQSVESLNSPSDFYCLSLNQYHNFFVTEHDFLVHNMIEIIAVNYTIGAGVVYTINWILAIIFGAKVIKDKIDQNNEAAKWDLRKEQERVNNLLDNDRKNNFQFDPEDPENKNLPEKIKQALKAAAISSATGYITKKTADIIAEYLGYNYTKQAPFDSHGRPVYKKGNNFISPDKDRHNGGWWKSYNRNGSVRGTLNWNLSKIIGK